MRGKKRGEVLRVSIVCHAGNIPQLRQTLESLLAACELPLQSAFIERVDIALIDNGPTEHEREKIEDLITFGRTVAPERVEFCILGSGNNIGYGAGHNLALDAKASDFHLVLNPDVKLARDALTAALSFMAGNEDCGVVAPAIFDQRGERQYLCKRYPTVFDLLMRGFAPRWVRRKFWRRLAKYEMRDVVAEQTVWNPPIVSGCFMLLRSSLLEKINGFDPQYFLYFEDFDLSLRAAQVSRIAYVPAVRIIHYGGHAAHKGCRHIFLFIRSAFTFFNTHGWKWY